MYDEYGGYDVCVLMVVAGLMTEGTKQILF